MNAAALAAAAVLVWHGSGGFPPGRPWVADGVRQLLLVNGWPGIGTLKQWDLPAWSISVEALCYAAFPLVLLLDRALRRATPAMLAIVMLLAMLASCYVNFLWYRAGDYQWQSGPAGLTGTLAGPAQGALGFIAGVCAFRCWDARNIVADAAVELCDAAVVAFGVVCVLGAAEWMNREFAVFLCPALILGATGTRSVTARVLASRPVHALGLISYALYMVHFPVKDAFAYYAPAVDPATPGGYVVILLCALALGVVAHVLVERPARRVLRRLFGTRGPVRGA